MDSYKGETLESLQQKEEGFCSEKLQIDNYNMDGNILIDGNKGLKLEYGDTIHVTLGTALK